MKNFTLILFISLFVTNTLSAQLNERALQMKNSKEEFMRDYYSGIRTYAIDKWDGDNSMIVYTINKQATSFFEIFMSGKYKEIDPNFKVKTINKWHVKKFGKLDFKKLPKAVIDWSMVEYEYKKQKKNSDY